MKQIAKMILVLSLAGLLSGFVLAFVSEYATPFIIQNRQENLNRAIYSVSPGAENYEQITVEGIDIYKTLSPDGGVVGYAVKDAGAGYWGEIEIMVGIDPQLNTVLGIEILESNETPGLGGKITGEEFKQGFQNLASDDEIGLVKNEQPDKGEVQAITGATISSRAVVDIVNRAVTKVRRTMVKEG